MPLKASGQSPLPKPKEPITDPGVALRDVLGGGLYLSISNPPGLANRTDRGREAGLCAAEAREVSPDAGLVSAIRAGDEQAMAQLYDRYSSIVYSVALRILGDTGAAEDVLQEVFMQLWRNPAAFDASRGRLPAWLAVIARNRAIDLLRKRQPETDISEVIVSVEPDMGTNAERNSVIEKIRDTLRTMAASQRSVLEMAFFEGLTHSEIATRTGEPLGTIKTRIRSGLLILRKAFSG